MKWDENSISVCKIQLSRLWYLFLSMRNSGSFYRAAIPKDITAGTPNPSQWGAPSATLLNTTCNIASYFWTHVIVFGMFFNVKLTMKTDVLFVFDLVDITICGQLLGSTGKDALVTIRPF